MAKQKINKSGVEKATKEIIKQEGKTPQVKDMHRARKLVSNLTAKQRETLFRMVLSQPKNKQVEASKKFLEMLKDGRI